MPRKSTTGRRTTKSGAKRPAASKTAAGRPAGRKAAKPSARKPPAKAAAAKAPPALAEYRRKRDFSRTREPAGGRSHAGKKLAFVIQKHAASHLHFDLRLELDG